MGKYTESLRFPHVYSHPGKVLVLSRIDGDITLTLEGAQDVAPVTMHACNVMDEVTPTASAHVWCVWLDETAVRISESDVTAIQRMVDRAIHAELPTV